MALRKRTGTAAKYGSGEPLVVVPPADELRNADVAVPEPAPTRPVARRSGGQIDGPEAARALAERAVIAKRERRARAEAFAGKLRLGAHLELFEPSMHAAPFSEEAEQFLRAKLAELARDSDDETSAGVVAIVRSGAWQLYAGRMLVELATSRTFLFVEGKDGRPAVNAELMLNGSRLMEAGRQSLLAAHHLQTLEAEARAKAKRRERPADVHAEVAASLVTEDER